MWTPKRKPARRVEKHCAQCHLSRLWRFAVARRGRWWVVVCVLTYACVGTTIALLGRDQIRWQRGQIVTEPVVARVGFEVVDQTRTKIRQEQAWEMEPGVYVPNTHYLDEVREKLLTAGRLALDSADKRPFEPGADETVNTAWPRQALLQLQDFLATHQLQGWDTLVNQFMQDLSGLAVLEDERVGAERKPGHLASKIVILHPSLGEQTQHDEDLVAVTGDKEQLKEKVRSILQRKLPEALRGAIAETVAGQAQPFYRLDAQRTLSRRVLKLKDVSLSVTRQHRENELLVPTGQQLGPADLELIHAEQRAYQARFGPTINRVAAPAVFAVFLLIAVGLWTYTANDNQMILRKPWQGLTLTALMLASQWLCVAVGAWQPRLALAGAAFSIGLVTVLVLVLYDQRFALAVGVIQALAQALSLNQPVGQSLVPVVGVAVSVGLLQQVRTRSTLVCVGFWAGLGMGLTAIVVGLADLSLHLWPTLDFGGQVLRIVLEGANVFVAGVAVGVLVQGVLPGLEKLFGVTTAMTLRELTDSAHPLLRRLAQEAPGTYQHSLRMADLAEAAADAIGADILLCRVGAMYHDIGKINKPLYFVENQAGGPNRHNKLSPRLSLLVIVGHVKDGIELARQYGLPKPIRHFIESHHGTTVVEYFFHAAKQQCGAENQPTPQEFEFRYPGPKPQTKEAAILMLCDGVESAARTLVEPNPSRIEHLVRGLATKRLMDGQFDECNVTLQDLDKVVKSIVKTLCAIYHARIQYPAQKTEKAASIPPKIEVAAAW